jgi:hypothetical protein
MLNGEQRLKAYLDFFLEYGMTRVPHAELGAFTKKLRELEIPYTEGQDLGKLKVINKKERLVLRLGMNAFKDILITEHKENELLPTTMQNVNEDFYRCVVQKISEVKEFEVDGMKFRATCERIE